MAETHFHTCTLCEATCGVVVTVDRGRVTSVRGDKDDPMSKGYLCAKGPALADIHHDPDRLTRPLVKAGDGWREAGWDEALDLVATRLRAVRAEHGNDALGIYYGNPTAHSLGLLTYGQILFKGLKTANTYSATSVDQLPHMLTGLEVLGHQLLMPVPDLDRTDLFICIGANPAASNGSLMTAPNVRGRMKAITERGGRVVLIDPRRTESAALASEHHFVRPGTDALFLLSMVQVLFAEELVRTTRPVAGLADLRAAAEAYAPERTAPVTGLAPEVVRDLARALATTERAVIYGRVGVSTQEFGGLCTWLLVALNVLTGHLDEVGGSMFATPAFDMVGFTARGGATGSFDTRRSRVRGLPNFGDEMPSAVLAEEIETPGDGQIRALLTAAGNPVLSTPNGRRLERALAGLDFMVSIDFYLNETTRFADVILPPTAHLERSHYDLLFPLLSVRNTARFVPPVFERRPDQRHDWEICADLTSRILGPSFLRRPHRLLLGALGPERIVDLALRTGPYGVRKGGLSLAKLKKSPHGIDLGPLQPRLPGLLRTRSKAIELAPARFLGDLPRLAARLERGDDALLLIGRRHIRSNNSWLHNSERLVSGEPRCTLQIHPTDAEARGLTDGDLATLTSPAGSVEVPVEVTDTVMSGVVCLPHGWGHHREGIRMDVAAAHAGVSANDVTDEQFVDLLTGTAAVNGVPVAVARVEVPAGVD
jgi:anaerobic selenocysteine-containing dehydrogenase